MINQMLLLSVFFSCTVAACPNASLLISAPTPMEALSGSCLHIPCNFTFGKKKDVDSGKTIVGVWMKNNPKFLSFPENVIFNSSKKTNLYAMNITGKLKDKNCTTLFSDLISNHTDKYYFRIENGKLMASAVCNALQIIIKDSPWSPSINISVGDLKEHQSVTITCSALTPCPHSPPELTWNLQQDSHRQTEKNTNGTFTTKIQETITLLDTHDGYNISCSARYPVNERNKTAETEVTLSVSYSPRNTSASISPSRLVSAGSWVELSCSSRAQPPPSFTWFRNSKHGAINVSVGQVYSFNATEGADYYCVATNDLGNQGSSVIPLNVRGSSKQPEHWVKICTGLIGIICFVCICAFICWRRKRMTDTTSFKLQTANCKESARTAEEDNEEEKEETLHYGEIRFLKRPHVSSLDCREELDTADTVYSKVKVSKRANHLKNIVDDPECLYAQVKKK